MQGVGGREGAGVGRSLELVGGKGGRETEQGQQGPGTRQCPLWFLTVGARAHGRDAGMAVCGGQGVAPGSGPQARRLPRHRAVGRAGERR